jgi:hypothetical protein
MGGKVRAALGIVGLAGHADRLRCLSVLPAATLATALSAVLDEHKPMSIYADTCHQPHPDGGACRACWLYTVCAACCADDYGMTTWCLDEHRPDRRLSCWPCETVRTIARSLGPHGQFRSATTVSATTTEARN